MDENSVLTSGSQVLGTARAVFQDYLAWRILDKKVDSEAARPFTVNDPAGGSYFVGADGKLYTSQSASSGSGLGSIVGPLLVAVGLGLISYAAYKAFH
jgi:hypothetical protein